MTTPPSNIAMPRCPHFGSCGGCQLQDLDDAAQLRLKLDNLTRLFAQAGVKHPEITPHTSRPYAYRNRIRLRIQRVEGRLRLGYNIRTTSDFLPITTCPIAAPVLFQTADALLTLAASHHDTDTWLRNAAEVELFTNHDLSRLQLGLFCMPRTKAPQGSFQRLFTTLQQRIPQLAGAAALAFDTRTGPTGRTLAEAGAPGLNYRVRDLEYWVSRGSFFQVNRFLVDTLVDLVCLPRTSARSGALAWDLYSGVGLFSRVLTSHFQHLTAVEANPVALADLRSALRGPQASATLVASTTLDFLRSAVLQRDRPDLVVLDPPRAGAGAEACILLNRIAPQSIVYVSCDPTTLTRDLAQLQSQYTLTALHMVDLFPQTSHQETVAILARNS